MKKLHGQADLVKDSIPEMKDKTTAGKLKEMEEYEDAAEKFKGLKGEVVDAVKGFILDLPKRDREVGQVKVGDYLLSFKVTDVKEADVQFTRKAATKVRIKFSSEDSE